MEEQSNESGDTGQPQVLSDLSNNVDIILDDGHLQNKGEHTPSQHIYPIIMPEILMKDVCRFPGYKYRINFKDHMDNIINRLSECTIDMQTYVDLSFAACAKLCVRCHDEYCCSYTFADAIYAIHREYDDARQLVNRAKFRARHHKLQTGKFYEFAGGYNPWDNYDSAVSDLLNVPRAITKGNRVWGVPDVCKQAKDYNRGPLSSEQVVTTLLMKRMTERLSAAVKPLFMHCTASWTRVCQALEDWGLDATLYLDKRHTLFEIHMAVSIVIADIIWSLNLLEERLLTENIEDTLTDNNILIKDIIMARRNRLVHRQHIYENGILTDQFEDHPVCFRDELLCSKNVCATYGNIVSNVNDGMAMPVESDGTNIQYNRKTALDLLHEDIVRKKAWAIKAGLIQTSTCQESGLRIACVKSSMISLKAIPHNCLHSNYHYKSWALSPKVINHYKEAMDSDQNTWFDYLLRGTSLIMYVVLNETPGCINKTEYNHFSMESGSDVEMYSSLEQETSDRSMISSEVAYEGSHRRYHPQQVGRFDIIAHIVNKNGLKNSMRAIAMPMITNGKAEVVICRLGYQIANAYYVGEKLHAKDVYDYSMQ